MIMLKWGLVLTQVWRNFSFSFSDVVKVVLKTFLSNLNE